MIILEGPDGSGKTTLQALLAKRYKGWTAKHSGGPLGGPEDLSARSAAYFSDPRVIWDRIFFISERIYGPIFGRTPPEELETNLPAYLDVKPVFVVCEPPDRPLPEQNNPLFDTPEYVAQLKASHRDIVRAYAKFFEPWSYPQTVFYNWSNLRQVLEVCDRHVFGVVPPILPNVVTEESFTGEPLDDPRDPVRILRSLMPSRPSHAAALNWAIDRIRRAW